MRRSYIKRTLGLFCCSQVTPGGSRSSCLGCFEVVDCMIGGSMTSTPASFEAIECSSRSSILALLLEDASRAVSSLASMEAFFWRDSNSSTCSSDYCFCSVPALSLLSPMTDDTEWTLSTFIVDVGISFFFAWINFRYTLWLESFPDSLYGIPVSFGVADWRLPSLELITLGSWSLIVFTPLTLF